MPVEADRVPVRPFLEFRDTKYYGLTVNPNNGEVYVADAIDYQQQGIVYRYSPQGKLIDEFYVGIIPPREQKRLQRQNAHRKWYACLGTDR